MAIDYYSISTTDEYPSIMSKLSKTEHLTILNMYIVRKKKRAIVVQVLDQVLMIPVPICLIVPALKAESI